MTTQIAWKEKLVAVIVYAAGALAAVIIYLQAANYSLIRESYDELRDAFSSPYPGYLVPTFNSITVDGDSITVGERPDGHQLLFVFSPAGEFSVASASPWRRLAESIAEEHPNVQVIGIDRDGEGAAGEFRDEHGFDFPVTTFPTLKHVMLYRVIGTPLVVHLDPRGEVLYSRSGVLTDSLAIDSVAVAVRSLLKQRERPATIPGGADDVPPGDRADGNDFGAMKQGN